MAPTAEVLVCTRCTLWPREVPEAPNGWTPSGLATVRLDDGVFTVTPHKDGCTQLGQVIRDRT